MFRRDDRPRERPGADGRGGRSNSRAPARSRAEKGETRNEQEQQWPDDVELLLHRERPVMLERRAVDEALPEIVRRLPDEVHVRPEEDRPDGVVADLRDAQLVEQDAAGDDNSKNHGERDRQNSAGAPRIETEDRDRPTAAVGLGLLRVLGRQQARDQVAGEDEEHIDAEEPAVEARHIEVVEHNESGLLVPAGDVTALATALEALIDDAPRRKALGHAGRARARDRFSAEVIPSKDAVGRHISRHLPPHHPLHLRRRHTCPRPLHAQHLLRQHRPGTLRTQRLTTCMSQPPFRRPQLQSAKASCPNRRPKKTKIKKLLLRQT